MDHFYNLKILDYLQKNYYTQILLVMVISLNNEKIKSTNNFLISIVISSAVAAQKVEFAKIKPNHLCLKLEQMVLIFVLKNSFSIFNLFYLRFLFCLGGVGELIYALQFDYQPHTFALSENLRETFNTSLGASPPVLLPLGGCKLGNSLQEGRGGRELLTQRTFRRPAPKPVELNIFREKKNPYIMGKTALSGSVSPHALTSNIRNLFFSR